MKREVITGTLVRSKTRRAPRSRNWIAAALRWAIEDANGTAKYDEDVYIRGDTLNTTGLRHNVWSLASIKPFGDIASGARVQCTALVRRWDNGNGHSLGGTLLRVQDVQVLPAEPEGQP